MIFPRSYENWCVKPMRVKNLNTEDSKKKKFTYKIVPSAIKLNDYSFFLFILQAKLDKSQNGKPSRVIHIRNIPNEVSDTEIIHLGMPFGRVTNVLVLKGKNQVRF